MKYLAAAVIAVPLGLAAFLLWPVDYDGQAAGIMRVAVFAPGITLAATFAVGCFALALSMISFGQLRRRHTPQADAE